MSQPEQSSVAPLVGNTNSKQVPHSQSEGNAQVPQPSSTVVEDPIDLSGDENVDEVPEFELTKKRKRTSIVWQHFKLQKINELDKAICNYCRKPLGGSSKHGTRHLHDHLKSCPRYRPKQKDIKQVMLNRMKQEGGKVTLGTYTFDDEKARRDLASMIILHEYPLSMVEHIGFRQFMYTAQPLFKVVSRNTIKNDILKIFDYEKSKMMRVLEKNKSRVSITTDMWTSNQKKGFMVVTAHFIDDAWRLQSRVLRFIYVPSPHTSNALAALLMECLLDWNLDRKLCTLTVDNCSTNDAMINIMLDKLNRRSLLVNGEFFHMRCCAHILNLIVKEGLDVISASVEKIRDSVVYWIATPKRVEKFESAAKQLQIYCTKKLAFDCKTRWNSTYLMLRVALEYESVFQRLSQREAQYKCLPSYEDWGLAREICKRLELFYRATQVFSGTKYPTANLYFPNICEIKLSLRNWSTSDCVEIRAMASGMIEKFDKYWSVIHGVLAVATVLDPQFKLKLVEFYFPRIYGPEGARIETEKIVGHCKKLVKEYDGRKSSSHTAPFSYSSPYESDLPSNIGEVDLLAGFDEFICNSSITENTKDELDMFLDEPILPRSTNFDLLGWWKANSTKYPILHVVARDILAIPVSTVASECAFSTSGRFVSPHRSRLNPNTLEAMMCAQDWLWEEIHEKNSSGSSYTGICSQYTDEEMEEAEPSCFEVPSS